MLHFFFKSPETLFEGMTDFHNHLLPAIDDGSKSVFDSEKMIFKFKELGFKKIIPSPHIYQEIYPNNPDTIKSSYTTLLSKLHDEDLKNMISGYGAEYMVDPHFLNNILADDKPLLFVFNKYILLEIHLFADLRLFDEAVYQLQQKGITPILAHPERNLGIKNISDFQYLKAKGVCFQLNALSLMGKYGSEVRSRAFELFKLKLYDFISTDAHSIRDLDKLRQLKLTKKQYHYWNVIKEYQEIETNHSS